MKFHWPDGGEQIANLFEEGLALLDAIKDSGWQALPDSCAWWDRKTIVTGIGKHDQAVPYCVQLALASEAVPRALATLYRKPSTLVIVHEVVARSYVEYLSTVWWILRPGASTQGQRNQDPSVNQRDETTSLRDTEKRTARMFLHVAESLRQERALAEEYKGKASSDYGSTVAEIEQLKTTIEAWTGEELPAKIQHWRIMAEGLPSLTERVADLIHSALGQEIEGVYRELSGVAHGNWQSLQRLGRALEGEGEPSHAWLPQFDRAERIAFMVLAAQRWVADVLLGVHGHNQDHLDLFRQKANQLLVLNPDIAKEL